MIKTKKGFIIKKTLDYHIILAIGPAGEAFRDILRVNDTGAFYWSLLTEGTTVDEMVQASMARFDDTDCSGDHADRNTNPN